MKHRIWKVEGASRDPWAFDCGYCGGLSWYATQHEANTFGCSMVSCRGAGEPSGKMPACDWCGGRVDDCHCSTQGFPIVYQR